MTYSDTSQHGVMHVSVASKSSDLL